MDSVGPRRCAIALLAQWLLCTVLFGFPAKAAAVDTPLPLEPAEQAWLRAHPTLTVGVSEKGRPPLVTVSGGEVSGFSYDYLQALAKRLGVQVRPRFYADRDAVMRAACAGEVQVVMDLSFSAERTRCLVYTESYLDTPLAVAGRRDDSRLQARGGLAGLRIAVEKGFSARAALAARYPSVTLSEVEDSRAGLHKVASNAADAYIGNPYVIADLLGSGKLGELGIVRLSDLPISTLHFAVPNRDAALAGALDKARQRISKAEAEAIRSHWLPPQPSWVAPHKAWLSPEDRAWLASLPVLRLGFAPDRAPLSYVDAAQHRHGISAEYLELLERTGVRMQRVEAPSRASMQAELEQGGVDLYVGKAGDVAGSDAGWVASEPFIVIPHVIVMRQDAEPVYGLDHLDGLRVGTFNAQAVAAVLRARAPGASLVALASAEDGLERLRKGEIDAYIDNLAVVDELIRSRYAGELRIAAPTGIDDALVLIAKRDYQRLIGIFNRALAELSERDRQRIRSDWLAADYVAGVNWRRWLKVLLPIVLVILAIGFVHGLGHLRLRREVAQRRLAELRLAEVTDNLPAVVYRFERDPQGRLSFPFIAGDTRALFGVDRERAMADERSLFARVHEQDQPRVTAEVERATRESAPIEIEFRAHAEHGWRWVRSRGMPHRSENGNLGWSGYWVDVTDAHEQAAALAEAIRTAENAAAAKAEFLATMSHEIRTPMSGVLGMLERLRYTRLDAEQRRVLGTVDDSAQMLRQILDDVLDYSRIEAGALALESAPVDLRALVDGALTLVAPIAHGKGLRLRSRVAPQLAANLAADGVRLRQILFNLLSNAVKFTEAGVVAVRVEVVAERAGVQRLRLSVSDTGIGISAEQQEKLFRPFSQAESSTTRRFGGSGLGLSICQRLIDLMGGQLRLHSTPGRGTTVEVEIDLPILRSLPGDNPLARRVARVSLADAAVADALADWLRGLGLAVVGSAAAQDAIAFVDAGHTGQAPTAAGTVAVTDDPASLTGGHGAALCLSANPLLGAEVARVCRQALGIEPAPQRADGEESLMPALPLQKARRVLVAEDHPTNQELIRWRLQQLGLPCDLVADGQAALAALERRAYDLLITDVRMPHMDGYRLAELIRGRESEQGGGHLPIIALTASALAAETQRCFEAGMDAYLSKPVRFDQLRAAIERWIPLGQPAEAREDADEEGADEGSAIDAPGLDMARLQRVYGSEEVVRQMLDSFADTTRQDLDRLDTAISAGEDRSVRDCLHRITGALRIFDANALVDEGDRLLHAAESDGVAPHAEALRSFSLRMAAYIERLTVRPSA